MGIEPRELGKVVLQVIQVFLYQLYKRPQRKIAVTSGKHYFVCAVYEIWFPVALYCGMTS